MTRWRTTLRRVVVPAAREVVWVRTTLPDGEAVAAVGAAALAARWAGGAIRGNLGTGIESAGIETAAAGASIWARIAPTRTVA
jgi:hypothetical protein